MENPVSRRLSHGEALELDAAMGEAVREMREALDGAEEGEAGKIIKRRENIVPNDDDRGENPVNSVASPVTPVENPVNRVAHVYELPGGWVKKIIPRKGGASGASGQWDAYLYAPDNTKIRQV